MVVIFWNSLAEQLSCWLIQNIKVIQNKLLYLKHATDSKTTTSSTITTKTTTNKICIPSIFFSAFPVLGGSLNVKLCFRAMLSPKAPNPWAADSFFRNPRCRFISSAGFKTANLNVISFIVSSNSTAKISLEVNSICVGEFRRLKQPSTCSLSFALLNKQGFQSVIVANIKREYLEHWQC